MIEILVFLLVLFAGWLSYILVVGTNKKAHMMFHKKLLDKIKKGKKD